MARTFVITHPDGTTLNLVSTKSVSYVTSAQLECQFQGTDSVKLKVSSAVPLDFYIGDTIELFGLTYTINQLPKASQDGNRSFEYELTFEGLQYELISRVFLLVDIDTMYDSLTGTIEDFMDEIIKNMQRDASHKWSWKAYNSEGIGNGETLNESFESKNCLEVLQQLMTDFECEFKIQQNSDGSRTIIVGSEGELAEDSLSGYVFEYGVHSGAYELKREPADNTNIITRLFCYGSSSNLNTLDEVYRYTRLCLPDKDRDHSYVEDEEMQALYGIKEGEQKFEDVMACCKGQIEKLAYDEYGCNEFYAYTKGAPSGDDYNIDFNPLDYLIPDATVKITIQTGELAGYSFEVLEDSCTVENDMMYFHLKKFADENGITFPYPDGKAFNFKAGDEFLFENIYLPPERIRKAEEELEERALEAFEETKMPQIKYSLTIDQQWLKHYIDPYGTGVDYSVFECGNLVNVKASALDIDNAIRINSLTRNLLADYDVTLTLADKTSPSLVTQLIGAMETQNEIIRINDLTNAQKARQNWYTMQEVLNMVFDVEGNYYSEKIAPLSIETTMLSVGARSQQFCLIGISFYPNYDGNANVIAWTSGYLEHYNIDDSGVVTFTIGNDNSPAELNDNGAYYVYARCDRSWTNYQASGTIQITQEQHVFDADPSWYWFLIGILSSVDVDGSGVDYRTLVTTYGSTTINGDQIRTGVIMSNDGVTMTINLNTGEIKGKITFTEGDDVYNALVDIEDEYAYLKKALPESDSTVIDGGLILTNILGVCDGEAIAENIIGGVVGSDKEEGVVFWAGSNFSLRTSAPFVVYNDGSVVMSQAAIVSSGGTYQMLLSKGVMTIVNNETGKSVEYSGERYSTLKEAGLGVASSGGSTYYMYAQKAEMSTGTISETTIFSGSITSPTTGTLTYPQEDFGGTMVLNVTSRGFTLTFVYKIYVTVNGTRYSNWWEGSLDYNTEGATKTVNCIATKFSSIPVNKGDSIKVEFSVEQTVTYRDGSSGGPGYASYDFPQMQINISGGDFTSKFFSNGIVLQADGNAGFGVLPEATGSSNPQFYMGDTYGNAFRLCNNIFSIRAGSSPTNVWRDATPKLLWMASYASMGNAEVNLPRKFYFSPFGVTPSAEAVREKNARYRIQLGATVSYYLVVASGCKWNGDGAWVTILEKNESDVFLQGNEEEGSTDMGLMDIVVFVNDDF